MHNDRRRKRSQANTAASATANSRPVRVNAGAPPGSHRIIGGPDAHALGADSPPAALPSIRTASGFGLARPPTGLLAGYGMNAFGGRGYVGGYGGGVFVPLRDGSAGTTTYGGGRYLLDTIKGADLGGDGGRLVVDLNFAYHPSCRYSPDWTCPLAPPGNTLDVPVRGGERLSPT